MQNNFLFDATILWRDTNEIENVLIATYDTEGLPEDSEVFFCLTNHDGTKQSILQDLFSNEGEWRVIDCELFS